MRFMVIVKADKDSEAGVLPDEKLLTEMGKYNEELVKAGVMLAGEGLQPSSKGARVRFSGDKRTVIDGPFTETKELIAGFWLWQVKSKEEAIEWVKRCPNPLKGESEIEIRQVFEASDFGAEFTPELREAEERLRSQLSAKQNQIEAHWYRGPATRDPARPPSPRLRRASPKLAPKTCASGGGKKRASGAPGGTRLSTLLVAALSPRGEPPARFYLAPSLIAPSRGFAATRHE